MINAKGYRRVAEELYTYIFTKAVTNITLFYKGYKMNDVKYIIISDERNSDGEWAYVKGTKTFNTEDEANEVLAALKAMLRMSGLKMELSISMQYEKDMKC